MAVQLTCDICVKDVKSIDDIGTLNIEYQVAARIVHVCKSCSKKINNKLKALSTYYGNEIAKDMRDWIIDLRTTYTPLT